MHRSWFLAMLIVLGLCAVAKAQQQKAPLKYEGVRVGFRSFDARDATSRFKVGLWAPVHIDLFAGSQGIPKGGELEIETTDSEDVGTVYKVPVPPLARMETRGFLGYTKPGNVGGDVKVRLQTEDFTFRAGQESHLPLDLNSYLYLSVGSRLADLHEALDTLNPQRLENQKMGRATSWPYFAAWENDVARLPAEWFGYNSVDLLILTTSNKTFLDNLLRDRQRQKALAQWVRRGGRLVISVSWRNQDLVAAWLQSPAWQPPLPVIPPPDQPDVKKNALKRLRTVEEWAQINDKPFPAPGQPLVPVALLTVAAETNKHWEVQAQSGDGRPLIGRMPYGLGQVTLLAFEVDLPPFSHWDGRKEFFKALVAKLGPRVGNVLLNREIMPGRGGFGEPMGDGDLSTQLHVVLDQFDVQNVSFGWVILFTLLYILVVGPLDYVILKKVLNRLEWTWITFPLVVILVTVVAYFTAYAMKGSEMKINQVDIVDFDLRTDLDENHRPRKAHAYGTTFFTLFSPHVQSYTLGVEPMVGSWLQKGGQVKPASADLVSWVGRPEYDWPGGMGRARAQGPFSRRPYEFAEEADQGPGIRGLKGVHIPVWMSKAFTASWEQALPNLPLAVDLYYHQNPARTLKISGTVQNLLPCDLQDLWLFYRDRCYVLDPADLPGAGGGSPLRKITLETGQARDIPTWVNASERVPQALRPLTQKPYLPTPIIKEIMLQERVDIGGNLRNHSLRALDLSWRLPEEHPRRESKIREAILYARLLPQTGQAEDLARTASLPTQLWIGDLPGGGRLRPSLSGRLLQDTYIRFIVPLRPADN